MPLSDLRIDEISIVKFDGQRFDGLKASVQASRIYMAGTSPFVEAGDLVVCARANGAEDTYRVLTPGFQEGRSGIPAGYQMSVHKLEFLSRPGRPRSAASTLDSASSRANVRSVEQSANVADMDSSLRAALDEVAAAVHLGGLTPKSRSDALELMGAIKEQCERQKPSRTVVGALLMSLPAVKKISKARDAVLSLIGTMRS